MASPLCHRCRLPNVTPAPSGLCETCHSLAGDTSPLPDGVVTLTRPSDADATHLAGTDTLADLLRAGGLIYHEELGGGGMGVVYKAVRDATRQTVAVKKLRPNCYTVSGLRRFVAEARSLAAVDHPQVVRLFEFNTRDHRDPHLVMEYVKGKALNVHLKEDGPLPPRRAAELIADAAHGVAAAHAKGVVHRDLKPANLLVTPDWRVKVADFGLGKLVQTPDDAPADTPAPPAAEGITVTGQMHGGTPGYMAPEQVDVRLAEAAEAIDVWGLGACLYAGLTGKAPFPGGVENIRRVLTDPVIPPREKVPTIPRELDAIVMRCLEKEPGKWYASAAAVGDDLDCYLRGDSTVAWPQSWPRRVWGRLRRTPRGVATAWAVAVVLVAATAIGAALLPRSVPPLPDPVDELALMQEQFLRGEEVVVVPEKGLPRWHQWVIGKAEVTDSPTRDGSAYIRPFGTGAVKLFDPPGDSYRVSVDLLHLDAQDPMDERNTEVGLLLFHQRASSAAGAWLDSFMTLAFRDWDVGVWKGRQPTAQNVRFGSAHWYHQRPGANPATSGQPFVPSVVQFNADGLPPGRWRRLVIEVCPEHVRVHWCDDPDEPNTKLRLVAQYTAAALNDEYRSHHESTNEATPLNRIDPTLVPRSWNPSGGFGLWAIRSGLAFRNVSVQHYVP